MESRSRFEIRGFLAERTVLGDGVRPAILIVQNAKIREIVEGTGQSEIESTAKNYPGIVFENFGTLVLMPGLVDSHVHVNEPGRTEWEGFSTATKAAAAGGVTTIADMPLNAIPPTTTLDHLRVKAREARGKNHVDVAFWAGLVPGNQRELRPLIDAGVVGFKCFLIPSGVDEFPRVTPKDVEKALTELKSTGSVLAFHAELELKDPPAPPTDPNADPADYDTFLQARPSDMETRAIEMICEWCLRTKCHIVHLSSAKALSAIKKAKSKGAPLTVETCYHYLLLSSRQVPKGATEFKCCPPIRDEANQDQLWDALKDGTLDMVVSDHSPCVEQLKTPGNFITAWGGIASLQFGLSLLWTAGKPRGLALTDLSKLLSAGPAKLCGLEKRKGTLSVGMDADFVIWDPDKSFTIRRADILYKNKSTPYEGKELEGRVVATLLGGEYIFKDGKVFDKPIGKFLLNDRDSLAY